MTIRLDVIYCFVASLHFPGRSCCGHFDLEILSPIIVFPIYLSESKFVLNSLAHMLSDASCNSLPFWNVFVKIRIHVSDFSFNQHTAPQLIRRVSHMCQFPKTMRTTMNCGPLSVITSFGQLNSARYNCRPYMTAWQISKNILLHVLWHMHSFVYHHTASIGQFL